MAPGHSGAPRPWKGLLLLSKGSGKPQENFKQGNDPCALQEDHTGHFEEEGVKSGSKETHKMVVKVF